MAKKDKNWTDSVIKSVIKNAGQSKDKNVIAGSLMTASRVGDNWKWIDFVDPLTGLPCLMLEWVFGTRGLLCGRMTKIEAMEGVGKSSFCFLMNGMAQRQGGFCWHGESEQAPPPPDYIASFGCDPDKLLIQQPGSIERGFYAMEEVIKSIRTAADPKMQYPILVALDSISGFASDALINTDDIPDPDNTKGLGAHARKVSQWFRDRGHTLQARQVHLMCTTQLKEKIEIGFSAPKGAGNKQGTTIAANPLNFHSSWRIRMTAQVLRDKEGEDVGEILTLLLTKNKLSPRNRFVSLHHYRDHGFDMMSPTLDWIKKYTPWTLPDGTVFDIEQRGAWIRSERLLDGKNVPSNREGKEKMMRAFYADKQLLNQCRELLRIRGFGFDFETRYTVEMAEREDSIADTTVVADMKGVTEDILATGVDGMPLPLDDYVDEAFDPNAAPEDY